MTIFSTVKDMQRAARSARLGGKRLALVPTMGALHNGHLSLVEEAKKHANYVVVSIFVNPTQFGPSEDLDEYPRELEADLEKLESGVGGVDAVFAPRARDMYPHGHENNVTWVTVERLDQHLCGRYRDGHFRGVTTVVTRLFGACMPHVGVFGLKDAQQFLILRRMVQDLCMDIELVGVPTYREKDGLAASSRNVYLSETHRQQAPAIYRALQYARDLITQGERDADVIRHQLIHSITSDSEGVVQYAEVVDTDFIQPIERIESGQHVLVAVAVYFEKTRLIDNVFVQSPAST